MTEIKQSIFFGSQPWKVNSNESNLQVMANTPRETESPGQHVLSRCITSVKTINKIHHILELEVVFVAVKLDSEFYNTQLIVFHFTFSVAFNCLTSEATSHICITFTYNQQQYLGYRFTVALCPLPCAQLSCGFSLLNHPVLTQPVPLLLLLPVPHQESLPKFFQVLGPNKNLLTLTLILWRLDLCLCHFTGRITALNYTVLLFKCITCRSNSWN